MPSWKLSTILVPSVYYDNLIRGHWKHEEIVYRDNNSKIVIDVEDTEDNRQWMRDYKARWKGKLDQLDLWLVSYEIDVE